MITCKCIEKFRDKNGNIKGYRLQDSQGKCLDVKPDQLKMAIFSKQIDVANLKLTADSRLIDKSDTEIQSAQDAKVEQRLLKLISLLYSNNRRNQNNVTKKQLQEIIYLLNSHYKLNIQIFEEYDSGFDISCGTLMIILGIDGIDTYAEQIVVRNGVYTRDYDWNEYRIGINIMDNSPKPSVNWLREWIKKLKEAQKWSEVSFADVHETIKQVFKKIKNKSNAKVEVEFGFEYPSFEYKLIDKESTSGKIESTIFCMSMDMYQTKSLIAFYTFSRGDIAGEDIIIDCNKPLDKKALQKQILNSFKIIYENYKK